VRDIHYRSKD
jgi:hypothetical protein